LPCLRLDQLPSFDQGWFLTDCRCFFNTAAFPVLTSDCRRKRVGPVLSWRMISQSEVSVNIYFTNFHTIFYICKGYISFFLCSEPPVVAKLNCH
jgi:hypothetical protein